MRKTHYFEQDGIRVDGHATKTEARKAWETTRDAFAKAAAESRPWIFHYAKHVVVVAPLPSGWEYTIVRPDDKQALLHASCYFGAANQVAAIVQALGALVQSIWTRECLDDGVLFAKPSRNEILSCMWWHTGVPIQ